MILIYLSSTTLLYIILQNIPLRARSRINSTKKKKERLNILPEFPILRWNLSFWQDRKSNYSFYLLECAS